MGRRNKPWFRPDIGWWVTTIARKQFRLAKGKDNKAEAERAFHELMAFRPRRPDRTDGRVCDLVEAFLTFYSKPGRIAPDTLRNYRFYTQKLAEACGYLRSADIQVRHIDGWVDSHPWNPTSEYNARRIAFRVFSWAVERGWLRKNPLKGMKREKPDISRRCLAFDEWCSLLRGARRPFRVFLWSLMETGARPSELRNLTWDMVREDRCVLPEHKTAKKTGKARIIRLSERMQRRLKQLKKRSRSPYVFVNSRGGQWTQNAVRLQVDRIIQRQGLAKDLCAYMVRHTFGTWSIMSGLDPATVAELMGHNDTDMIITVYCHLAEQSSHMKDAANRAGKCPSRPRPHAA
jgi:integrase